MGGTSCPRPEADCAGQPLTVSGVATGVVCPLHHGPSVAEPSGHTLLTEALRVINRAIEAHKDASPWREIVARTKATEPACTFGVAICEGDPRRIVDRYSIRAHEGRFRVLEHGRLEPTDWEVSVAQLERIVAHPDRFVGAPEQLGLDWLEDRLSIRPEVKRPSAWRIGRARRPKK